ncbi:MAG: PAS domain S-box protein [Steroidobacteraceae bacterium]
MRVHPLVQINYGVRTTSFAYVFFVVGLLLWERQEGTLLWALLAAQFLVYPHLVYLRARWAKDTRRAELDNMYVDSALLGIWAAMLGFPTWIAYAFFFGITLNNAINRGWQGAACAAVCFALGALVWIAFMGFAHSPATSDLITTLCFFGSAAYAGGVGLVVWGQNKRLREARENLRASEERYRLIAENAGDLIAMVDLDGRWLYASPAYGRMLAAEDLVPGADAFRRVHDDDQFRVRAALQVLLRSGDSCRLRMRMHTRDGDVRRLEALVHQVREETGTVKGAVIVSRDVTELRVREEQLEVAAHAFERMAEAIIVTAADGRILTVNKAFSEITGFAAEEVIGRRENEFRSAMQPPEFYDDLYAEVLRAGFWSGTTWSRRRDGTLYREWRNVSAVRDAEGRVTHYVTLFRELNGRSAAAQSA